ncbi:chondroitin sulfate N-acetylgalactosaminyltransferase 1-like isoform X2 [Pollicipes pollicipes]|uniref:chondroitin sulfate N-acetylgalactosaminyltransferase 1-like isoform X1 n=1 Tax=Pollicipes pollicipes TaxID=41117 RepID=UPI001884B814|nr:chondroitin sulfate N-acetylgalactosaminyltransferase 1-like isoform X1 [Pollicipes pollicipes]XP_037092124.1 chondroitin sulfate N-acetylgalactosaminyltransferase 1-like isoform X2 [Pollicipes pollicipes]
MRYSTRARRAGDQTGSGGARPLQQVTIPMAACAARRLIAVWLRAATGRGMCRNGSAKTLVVVLALVNAWLIVTLYHGMKHGVPVPQEEDLCDGQERLQQKVVNCTPDGTASRPALQDENETSDVEKMDDLIRSRLVKTTSWRVFTKDSVWDTVNKSPQLGRRGALNVELLAAVRTGAQHLNQASGGASYTAQHFLDGRYKQVLGAGEVYVLHFASEARPGRVETVRLVRRAGPLLVDARPGYDHDQLVYVVVPYYRRPDAFAEFAAMFEQLVVARHENLRLVVMFYWRGQPAAPREQLARERRRVADTLHRLNKRARRPVARLVDQEAEFSRGHALLEGARSWQGDDDVLLFFCDVDMFFDTQALHRCRANTAPGRRVYYPVVFSTFSPELYFRAWRKKPASLWQMHPISGDVGFWRDFGFGMTCQYKSDFDRVAGEFLVSRSWGGEDSKLYRKYQQSTLEIVRAPDPGLVHIYHRKQCDRRLLGKKYHSCMSSLRHSEASMKTWARFVQQLKAVADDSTAVHDMLALALPSDGDKGDDEMYTDATTIEASVISPPTHR